MTLTIVIAAKVLVLSFVANSAPIFGAWLFGSRWSTPIDGGRLFRDGRAVLGKSKTIRGVILSLTSCMVVAELLDMTWLFGLVFGAASMAGDALSSFIKRRLDIPPSGRFIGLDQLPEILLPLLVCAQWLAVDLISIILLAAIFCIASLGLSELAFKLGLKKRPY